jgi:hypothetical protein
MGIGDETGMEAMVVAPLRSTAVASVPRHLASSRAISPGTGRGAGALLTYSLLLSVPVCVWALAAR